MAWTATEQANSGATAFDVRLRVYAGPDYRTLDLTAFAVGSLPPGWASADEPGDGWTEITDRTTQNGSLTHERSGSALRWRAELNGWNYDAGLLGIGRAILVLRTSEAAGVTTGPGLWFVGQVCAGGSQDDCKHGGQWTRTIRGTDSLLERANAPRLTAGPINLADGASASASSTLATPEAEAGNGEFMGSTANVGAGNAVDGNLNTVWISADAPTVTGETPLLGAELLDKVFIKPLTGYDQAKLWWVEIYNGAVGDMRMNGVYTHSLGETIIPWGLEDQAGGVLTWPKEWNDVLRQGQRGIICSSRADFEAYTGGARSAAWIKEAKSWPLRTGETRLSINPTAGWVRLRVWTVGATWHNVDTVAWTADGSAPAPSVDGWSGAALNAGTLPAGSVWRRSPSGNDSHTAADWVADAQAEPGDYAQPGQVEWLPVEPAGQDAAWERLTGMRLFLTNTTGFPNAGNGVCEGDAFSWTARTRNYLSGVTGLSGHSQGARVYATDGGVAQTGWPAKRIEIRRRAGLSVIKRLRLYIQQTGETAPRMPGEDGWDTDWDANYLSYVWPPKPKDDSTEDCITFSLAGPGGLGYRWVRRVLIYIEEMSDGGRAKINDVRLLLAQAELDGSGQGDLDGATSAGLARHLLTSYGLADEVFVDSTPAGHGALGNHATAIAPYPAVLEDLARVTGCCVCYRLDGKIEWTADPWHPTGTADALLTPYATLDDSYARGSVRCSDSLPAESAVVVRSRTPDGESQFESQYPVNAAEAALKRELDGYVCADSFSAWALAESLYCRNGLFLAEADAGPGQIGITLTGVGEWLRPDVWVQLILAPETQQVAHLGTWGAELHGYLIERVTHAWGKSERGRSWTATADCRRFRR